jgi:hypothetical protein
MCIFYQFDHAKSESTHFQIEFFFRNPEFKMAPNMAQLCRGNFAILRDGLLEEVSILGFLESLRTMKYVSSPSDNRKCKIQDGG